MEISSLIHLQDKAKWEHVLNNETSSFIVRKVFTCFFYSILQDIQLERKRAGIRECVLSGSKGGRDFGRDFVFQISRQNSGHYKTRAKPLSPTWRRRWRHRKHTAIALRGKPLHGTRILYVVALNIYSLIVWENVPI